MSYPQYPQQPPRYGPPRRPPHKKSRIHVYILVFTLMFVTGAGCYAVGRGDRASNRVTVAETVTASVTVTVTARRPKPKATRTAKATQSAEPARRRTRQPVQPTRTRRPTQRPEVESGVHPGAFCSDEGALGRTKAGTLMRCTSKAGDRARWRSA